MTINPWALFDEFTIHEASSAIIFPNDYYECEIAWKNTHSALSNAILNCTLPATFSLTDYTELEDELFYKAKFNDFIDNYDIYIEKRHYLNVPHSVEELKGEIKENVLLSGAKIKRDDLIKWLDGRGVRPPCFVDKIKPKTTQLDPRERNTLHLIIAALANKAKVEISDTNRDRVATINRSLSGAGLPPIAEKTIRKHLDAAAKTANEKRE